VAEILDEAYAAQQLRLRLVGEGARGRHSAPLTECRAANKDLKIKIHAFFPLLPAFPGCTIQHQDVPTRQTKLIHSSKKVA